MAICSEYEQWRGVLATVNCRSVVDMGKAVKIIYLMFPCLHSHTCRHHKLHTCSWPVYEVGVFQENQVHGIRGCSLRKHIGV